MSLTLSGRAMAQAPIPGSGADALPAVVRVGVAGAKAADWAVSSSAQYGWIESVGPVRGSHHRLGGKIAGAANPLPWLAAALVLEGRYDSHPRDARGTDYSIVGDPRLIVRASTPVGAGFGLGAELGGWFPGSDAPSFRLDATTLDVRGLASWWHPDRRTVLALLAGYRFEQSAASISAPQQLRAGDRISLGLSSFDAWLVGLGLCHSLGPARLLAEVTGDWLLGGGAPDVTHSPWRVAMGARANLSRALAFEVHGELLLAGRPGVAPNDPLAPIQPRIVLGAGLRYAWWDERVPLPQPAPQPAAPPTPSPKAVKLPPQPPTIEEITLRGRITDQIGQPLDGTHVTVILPDRKLEVDTASDGTFSFDKLPRGEVQLRVDAPGYVGIEQRITTRSETPVTLVLEPALPAGQLRGLIRSFAGTPVRAHVAVEPIGVSAETDADGRFELDLAPGKYQVTIDAAGYRSQRKNIRVEDRGVTVINAELEVKR